MEKKKSNPILRIAAICLVTLAVVSLIGELAYPSSAMMMLTAFTRSSSNPQQFIPTNGQRGNFNSGGTDTPNNRIRSGTPQAGTPGQFQPNGQFGTSTNRQFVNRSSSPLSWLIPATLGLFVLLTITISIFLVKKKKWAAILAIVLAFLTLIVNASAIYTAFGMATFMRMGNQNNLIFTIIESVLAVAIIVLLLLPKGRTLWAVNTPKSISDDDDDLDIDEEVDVEPEPEEPENIDDDELVTEDFDDDDEDDDDDDL